MSAAELLLSVLNGPGPGTSFRFLPDATRLPTTPAKTRFGGGVLADAVGRAVWTSQKSRRSNWFQAEDALQFPDVIAARGSEFRARSPGSRSVAASCSLSGRWANRQRSGGAHRSRGCVTCWWSSSRSLCSASFAAAFNDVLAPDAFAVQLLGTGYAGRVPVVGLAGDAAVRPQHPARTRPAVAGTTPVYARAETVPTVAPPDLDNPTPYVPPLAPPILDRARETFSSILFGSGPARAAPPRRVTGKLTDTRPPGDVAALRAAAARRGNELPVGYLKLMTLTDGAWGFRLNPG